MRYGPIIVKDKTGREIELRSAEERDAEDLIRFQKPLGANVNLIPYNQVAGLPFKRPAREKTLAFAQYLKEKNVNVTLRGEHGPGIQAACGQLAVQKG